MIEPESSATARNPLILAFHTLNGEQVLEALAKHGLTLQNFSSIQEQQMGGWTQVCMCVHAKHGKV